MKRNSWGILVSNKLYLRQWQQENICKFGMTLQFECVFDIYGGTWLGLINFHWCTMVVLGTVINFLFKRKSAIFSVKSSCVYRDTERFPGGCDSSSFRKLPFISTHKK